MFEALGVSGWNIRLIKIANYGIGTSFTIEWSDEEDAWMTDEFGETEKAVCTRGFGPDPIETEMRLFDAEAQDFASPTWNVYKTKTRDYHKIGGKRE